MAETTFLIAALATGSDPDDWTEVQDLLSAVSGDITLRALEWEYQDYSKSVILGDGTQRGLGYPKARWLFKGLRPEQRENLRDFVSDLTAEVYIRTPTNETSAGVRTWMDFSALLHWTVESELVGINYVEMVELTFTHLVPVGA
ncbi:MAG: hypothetical protein LC114_17910 [Bryobacterales bacterium]|nr:hypothetical protein [Bryobacterales bacterium]